MEQPYVWQPTDLMEAIAWPTLKLRDEARTRLAAVWLIAERQCANGYRTHRYPRRCGWVPFRLCRPRQLRSHFLWELTFSSGTDLRSQHSGTD